MPNQLSGKQMADLVSQRRLAELALQEAEQRVRNQQGGSTASLVVLMEERDRLYAVFVELDRQVKAL